MRVLACLFGALAILTCAREASAQSLTSVYTDLSGKTCKELEHRSEGAYALLRCPGVGGYYLLDQDFDSREDVTVVTPRGTKHPLKLQQVISVGFSTVGPKAEWRAKRERGRMVPVALIFRFNVNENPSEPSQNTSYLIVSKITAQSICVTDKIRPGEKANEEARRAADGAANRPCLQAP